MVASSVTESATATNSKGEREANSGCSLHLPNCQKRSGSVLSIFITWKYPLYGCNLDLATNRKQEKANDNDSQKRKGNRVLFSLGSWDFSTEST